MIKQKTIVRWSPHQPNLFLVGSDDVRLYEIKFNKFTFHNEPNTISATAVTSQHQGTPPTRGGLRNVMPTQRRRSFQSLSVCSELPQLKCVDWNPNDNDPLLIAAGLGSGKLSLVRLGGFDNGEESWGVLGDSRRYHESEDAAAAYSSRTSAGNRTSTGGSGLPGRSSVLDELVPKYPRPCNAVAWNPVYATQIAVGLEKVRSDYCTLIWDVSQGTEMTVARMADNGDAGPLSTSPEARGQTSGGGGLPPRPTGGSSRFNAPGLGAGTYSGATGSGAPPGNAGKLPSATQSFLSQRSMSLTRTDSLTTSTGVRPAYELANSEATVALAWVPEQPMSLVTGTGFKWLRMYDLRKPTAPLSVVAHTKSVQGVVFDPHRPNILATFSDGLQEVVKVWDLRKFDTAVTSIRPTSKTLSQIAWSPSRAGVLATASPEERWISFWDVLGPSASSTSGGEVVIKPYHRRHVSEPVASFSWQQILPSKTKPKVSGNGIEAAFPNRLLVGTVSGLVDDLSQHESMPLSLNPLTGLSFSCGRLLFTGPVDDTDRATGALSQNEQAHEDISTEMYRRAKAGYNVELNKTLSLLGSLIDFEALNNREGSLSQAKRKLAKITQLHQVWSWVQRSELMCTIKARYPEFLSVLSSVEGAGSETGSTSAATNTSSGAPGTSPLSTASHVLAILKLWRTSREVLVESSMDRMLSSHRGAGTGPGGSNHSYTTSHSRVDTALGCEVYSGNGRSLVLMACGWDPSAAAASPVNPSTYSAADHPFSGIGGDGSYSFVDEERLFEGSGEREESSILSILRAFELPTILGKHIAEGQYERAAAIAVFHGDLRTAVQALRRGSFTLRAELEALLTQRGGGQHYRGSYSNRTPAYLQEESTQINDLRSRAELLEIVAVALAGYPTAVESASASSGASLWREMCTSILQKPEMVRLQIPAIHYLRALCSFLIAIISSGVQARGEEVSRSRSLRSWKSAPRGIASQMPARSTEASQMFGLILRDSSIALCDRVAFAARFLPGHELQRFVTEAISEAENRGAVDGIFLTGMTSRGFRLLQTYVNRTTDIQTAALLSARMTSFFGDSSSAEKELSKRWIAQYHDLLNQWKLWHVRASFDVARNQLVAERQKQAMLLSSSSSTSLRQAGLDLEKMASAPDTEYGTATSSLTANRHSAGNLAQMGNTAAGSSGPTSVSGGKKGDMSSQGDSVPPHLYVRCNYCATSLSLSSLLRSGSSHATWLSKSKPKLTCCPTCRKPLPRCSLCLLSLASLNPYLELQYRKAKQYDFQKQLQQQQAQQQAPQASPPTASQNSLSHHFQQQQLPSPLALSGEGGGANGDYTTAAGSQGSGNPSSSLQGAGIASGAATFASAVAVATASSGTADDLTGLANIPFTEWWTWCQTCRHGGHSHHMSDWFTSHDECPVSGCSCKCLSLDSKSVLSTSPPALPSPLDSSSSLKGKNLSLTPNSGTPVAVDSGAATLLPRDALPRGDVELARVLSSQQLSRLSSLDNSVYGGSVIGPGGDIPLGPTDRGDPTGVGTLDSLVDGPVNAIKVGQAQYVAPGTGHPPGAVSANSAINSAVGWRPAGTEMQNMLTLEGHLLPWSDYTMG